MQFDVRIASLYGKLEEDIYMEIPEGLNVERNIFVCKLNKSLYELKQTPQWNQIFITFLNNFNLKPCDADPFFTVL